MSRSQHRRENNHKTIEQIFELETQGIDARFFSGEIDITELPSAYKNADAVQAQMETFNGRQKVFLQSNYSFLRLCISESKHLELNR